jgi:hypothetical protein
LLHSCPSGKNFPYKKALLLNGILFVETKQNNISRRQLQWKGKNWTLKSISGVFHKILTVTLNILWLSSLQKMYQIGFVQVQLIIKQACIQAWWNHSKSCLFFRVRRQNTYTCITQLANRTLAKKLLQSYHSNQLRLTTSWF